jgi:hypothetical protein
VSKQGTKACHIFSLRPNQPFIGLFAAGCTFAISDGPQLVDFTHAASRQLIPFVVAPERQEFSGQINLINLMPPVRGAALRQVALQQPPAVASALVGPVLRAPGCGIRTTQASNTTRRLKRHSSGALLRSSWFAQ